jgi:hypothetical protein
VKRPQFKAYILKRRTCYGKGWFCYTREITAYSDSRGIHGPFSKKDAKLVKESAKREHTSRFA